MRVAGVHPLQDGRRKVDAAISIRATHARSSAAPAWAAMNVAELITDESADPVALEAIRRGGTEVIIAKL